MSPPTCSVLIIHHQCTRTKRQAVAHDQTSMSDIIICTWFIIIITYSIHFGVKQDKVKLEWLISGCNSHEALAGCIHQQLGEKKVPPQGGRRCTWWTGDDKATVLWSVGTTGTGTGTTGARCIVLECGPRKGKLLKASEHECIQRTLCVDFVCNLVPRNFCIALGVNTLSHRASVLQQTLTVILHLYRWHLYLLDMYAWIYVSNHNMLMRFSNIFVKVKSQYTKQLTPNPSHLMSTTTRSFHFGVNCPFTQNISMPFFETTNSMVSL